MKRKPVILAAAVLTVLFSGLSVYGYWTDKVEAKCDLSFAVPVHVQIRGEEALIIDMDKAEEAIPLSPVPEEDIEGIIPDGEKDSGTGSDLNLENGTGENTGAETGKDGQTDKSGEPANDGTAAGGGETARDGGANGSEESNQTAGSGESGQADDGAEDGQTDGGE